MLLDLRRFRGPSDRLERTYEPGQFDLADADFRLVAPVRLAVDIHKDGPKFRLVGHVQTTLECACSRCLEAFPVPVEARFDLLYLPASESLAAGGAGRKDEDDEGGTEVREDDIGVTFYQDDTIDLGEVMREQFYLALPMKPLCREDCQGLCAVCGVNRNRETCQCSTAWVDPRMDALRKLRDGR
jgi:uncharacterized protein